MENSQPGKELLELFETLKSRPLESRRRAFKSIVALYKANEPHITLTLVAIFSMVCGGINGGKWLRKAISLKDRLDECEKDEQTNLSDKDRVSLRVMMLGATA